MKISWSSSIITHPMRKKTASTTSPKTSFGTGNLSASWKSSHLDRLVRTSPAIIRQPHRRLFIHAVKEPPRYAWQCRCYINSINHTGLQKIESCAIIDLSFSGTDFHGDVAQLGERTVRIRKVESSILFVSTMPFGARQNISRLAAAGLLFINVFPLHPYAASETAPQEIPQRKIYFADYFSA